MTHRLVTRRRQPQPMSATTSHRQDISPPRHHGSATLNLRTHASEGRDDSTSRHRRDTHAHGAGHQRHRRRTAVPIADARVAVVATSLPAGCLAAHDRVGVSGSGAVGRTNRQHGSDDAMQRLLHTAVPDTHGMPTPRLTHKHISLHVYTCAHREARMRRRHTRTWRRTTATRSLRRRGHRRPRVAPRTPQRTSPMTARADSADEPSSCARTPGHGPPAPVSPRPPSWGGRRGRSPA